MKPLLEVIESTGLSYRKFAEAVKPIYGNAPYFKTWHYRANDALWLGSLEDGILTVVDPNNGAVITYEFNA
jgi:hypothetical protein